jgi:hypothetical protein
LLGLSPPLGHSVQVIQHALATRKTATEEIGDLIDEIRGISKSESAPSSNTSASSASAGCAGPEPP